MSEPVRMVEAVAPLWVLAEREVQAATRALAAAAVRLGATPDDLALVLDAAGLP